MKTKTILAILFLATLAACRYKEGPSISFKKAENRLIGVWEVKSFSINAFDHTLEYKEKCNCDFHFNYEKTTKVAVLANCKPDTAEFYGHYSFVDGTHKTVLNTILYIPPLNDSTERDFVAPTELFKCGYWTILRLTKDEMKLKSEFQENTYTIELQKTKYYTP